MRHALRLLRRTPAFTVLAVSCIALGIGVTTTMFSAVNGILVRALPFLRAGELVAVRAQNRERDVHGAFVAWADFAAWRSENRSFADLGLWAAVFPTLDGESGVERVEGASVSGSVLPILGVPAFAGRLFLPNEEQQASDAVVLGYGLWQRRYGGDRAIVGRPILVNGRPHIVAGIMPLAFDFPERAQLWILTPWSPAATTDHSRTGYAAIGRLKPGVTLDDARRDLSATSRRLEEQFPAANRGWDAEPVSLRDDLVGPLKKPILILLGAAAFVLLIACANVANLMLARGEVRRREMAIRVAIGAGRLQIVKQVLTETVLLALAGGAAGGLIAHFGVRLLTLAFPDGVPSYLELSIDATVLAFTVLVSLLTGLLFGIAPALRATRVDAASSLRDGERGGSGGIVGKRVRDALVAAEVALSLVLMVGATLLIRSDLSLERGLGFDARGVVSFRIPLPSNNYDDAHRRAFYDRLAERLRALHGVVAVGTAQGLPFGPLGGSSDRGFVAIEGRAAPLPGEDAGALRLQISPDYLRTLGIPVVRGRSFTAADQADPAPRVGIVNEAFARRRFPDGEPVGKRIRFVDSNAAAPWITIVGVVRNVRQDRPPRPIEPAVYVPFTQGSQTMAVRTTLADPLAIVADVRAIVREMDTRLPTYLVQTLDHAVALALWRPRLQGQVFGIFAGLALVLAVFGIYAVISYTVAQRTRELGVRMALGATPRQMMALVLSHGARLALIGVAIGVAGALALTRLLTGLLYDVRPTDPATFIGVSLLLGCAAVLAAVTPARRAARVDPLIAMRAE